MNWFRNLLSRVFGDKKPVDNPQSCPPQDRIAGMMDLSGKELDRIRSNRSLPWPEASGGVESVPLSFGDPNPQVLVRARGLLRSYVDRVGKYPVGTENVRLVEFHTASRMLFFVDIVSDSLIGGGRESVLYRLSITDYKELRASRAEDNWAFLVANKPVFRSPGCDVVTVRGGDYADCMTEYNNHFVDGLESDRVSVLPAFSIVG